MRVKSSRINQDGSQILARTGPDPELAGLAEPAPGTAIRAAFDLD